MQSILQESTSHSTPWYTDDPRPTHLTPDICGFFEEYSGIQGAEIAALVLKVREKAWHIRPYPCIGSFAFLDFCLRDLPNYAALLRLLKTGGRKFVDLGCCFGQNMRWLAKDGVSPDAMIGVDLLPDFWDLSFDMFKDRDKMGSRLIVGDVLHDGQCKELGELERNVDVVFAGNLFHLFGWDDQVKVATRAVQWSRGPGSIICGEMIGMVEARSKLSGWGESGTTHFWQDEKSWRILWEKVEGITGTAWDVWTHSVRTSELGDCYSYMGDSTTKMRFVCTRNS
ncbi:hypothetical protein HYALB_00000476 [Hymenoscyphus albidus]|uniref:Methyltransferase type 11 domain-containing protein n=1 Tax=Hymenoscyphus albidus TaxID=595503 RepID=A0A9N9LLR3_9HELO|nr:hypothetical protein HYALB_00000476 [Hymenoscyphus albidus]